jgi:tetratricopeptide (TPR) repeat protein
MASSVAESLAAKAPAKADEIFHRALGLAENFSPATLRPLEGVLGSYAGSLASQQRWGEFDQALEHYKATLLASQGDGTGWLEDVLHRRTETIYRPERQHDALVASQELVKLEESLDGATSDLYLRATETLAHAMEANGDRPGALPLHGKMVAISDLVCAANDSRRATVRMNAAMAFANERQFDQAEELAREAVAIGERGQAPQPSAFTSQLQQILQMKKAAQSTSPPKQ